MMKSKKLICLLLAIVMMCTPMSALAADTRPSDEVMAHEDWDWINTTRPTQEFSEIFRATVCFKPTNVSAVAGKNNIHITADFNTSARMALIEWSYHGQFRDEEDSKFYRNVKYTQPVLVTRKSQQKYNYDKKCYSSSNDLSYTQGKKVLWHKPMYHPKDQWAYQEPTQDTVNAVRKKITFRKTFLMPNAYEAKGGYVRITYLYTSLTTGKTVRSKSVVVRIK